jgi:hypothetical protein
MLVKIIEYVVCNDHFIHQHFHNLSMRLLWCKCTGDISRIAYHAVLRCESCLDLGNGVRGTNIT